MINLELYRVFYTVARCGSLTKAAEKLYISQPAVSQAIKQLETQLNTPLFKRTRRGMQLTAQGGEAVFRDVERAIKILDGVEDTLAELRLSPTGTLRIGASETIFEYVLAEKIARYHKKFPQVKIELTSDVSPNIIALLKSDRLDVGFLNLPVEQDDAIWLGDPIFDLHDVFVAGAAFAELCNREVALSELMEYPLILLDKNTVARTSLETFCSSNGLRLSPAVEVDSWDFMKRLATLGMGVGCLPREYVKRRLLQGELFELNVTPKLPTRAVGVALPADSEPSYAVRTFLAV